MKYNFKHSCPACKIPWNDASCKCGLYLCGYEADFWVRKDLEDFVIFWENNGSCAIKKFTRTHNTTAFSFRTIVETDNLPFNMTLDQIHLYITFS